jgi:hypothetical protein
MHYIWIIFFNSYLPRALVSPGYIPFAALLLGGLGLRIAKFVRARQTRHAADDRVELRAKN